MGSLVIGFAVCCYWGITVRFHLCLENVVYGNYNFPLPELRGIAFQNCRDLLGFPFPETVISFSRIAGSGVFALEIYFNFPSGNGLVDLKFLAHFSQIRRRFQKVGGDFGNFPKKSPKPGKFRGGKFVAQTL